MDGESKRCQLLGTRKIKIKIKKMAKSKSRIQATKLTKYSNFFFVPTTVKPFDTTLVTYFECCRILFCSTGAMGIEAVTVDASTCRNQTAAESDTLTPASFTTLRKEGNLKVLVL